MVQKKKLIEVALPLQAINEASAREKSIRHGHPSTLHLWWARRPLAAARAVIFAQMVDDPSAHPDLFPTEKAQEKERQRLFRIIEELVKWENTTNEKVLQQARDEIWQSWRYTCAENADHPRAKELFDRFKLPAFHDPFAGGGALPLEAQRLGLEAYASDLNPVAVLINKAMIEIPPKFAAKHPVNPNAQKEVNLLTWEGTKGLAEDILYYGQWMRNEAEKRIGHLFPKVKISYDIALERPALKPYIGEELTVIAWLWARTIKSPNPAFSEVEIPLVSTFMLSTKEGKMAYVEPVLEGNHYYFQVKDGKPSNEELINNGTKLSRGANFKCLMSNSPISSEYIYKEANSGRMGARLMAIVAEGENGRIYLAPTKEMEDIAFKARPSSSPQLEMPNNPRWFSPPLYGLKTFGDLFTSRQLVVLETFSDLVKEASEKAQQDAIKVGMLTDDKPLFEGGTGAKAYADAIALYLGLSVSKTSNRASTLCTFKIAVQCPGDTFGRQALAMSWDYAEANTLSGPSGSFESMVKNTVAGLLSINSRAGTAGFACQSDASSQLLSRSKIISTDPPYYDNIGYADLSDYFYIWLRRSLKDNFPDIFATLAVPKAEELVATPYRHGGKESAERFFLQGMSQAMRRLAELVHPAFPVTIYYAFKQSENDSGEGLVSTGWETFLDSVIRAGFGISGTWPVRTERENRKINQGTNALASSIVLVCRPQPSVAPTTTRRDFVAALKTELPIALAHLQRSNIAPVDLAQAAIGPGMAIYTRYAKVLDAKGNSMSVHEALALINQTLDEVLAEQEGDFDADSRWALAWFEQFGFSEGEYGVAETLSKAKNTSVAGMVEAGILVSKGGRVRLLQPKELPSDWDPELDSRLTAWEMVHQLIRVLEKDGERAAADLASKLGSKAEIARELCYRLYTLCERKKRASLALAYNALVQSWPEIIRLAKEGGKRTTQQAQLFEEE